MTRGWKIAILVTIGVLFLAGVVFPVLMLLFTNQGTT